MIRSRSHCTSPPPGPLRTGLALAILASCLVATPALPQGSGTAFLGITSRNLRGEEARGLGLACADGSYLETVYEHTAAEAAGLEEGDIVLEFDGEKIFDDRDLTQAIRRHRPGDSVSIQVMRGSERVTLQAALGSRRDWEARYEGEQPPWSRFLQDLGEWLGGDRGPRLGVQVQELHGQLAGYFGVGSGEGLLVTDVEPGAVADRMGLEAGDVIVQVADRRVGAGAGIRRALRDKAGQTIPVTLIRRGERLKLTAVLEDE